MSEPDAFKISEAVIDLWRCYTIERDMAKELEAENARLKAEVERLTLENSQYEEHHKYGQNVITYLREDVERLTTAGDAMMDWIDHQHDDSGYPHSEAWEAAKEGKQP